MPVLSPADVQYQTQHISDDKSKQLLATCIVSSCVASVAVALRIFARRVNRLETSLQLDDYMTIIAFVFTAAYIGGQFYAVHLGMGRHFILVTEPAKYKKLVFANSFSYGMGLTCIKLSIILLYRRLFPAPSVPRFHRILYCIVAYIVAFQLYQIFHSVFGCNPANGHWNGNVHGKCKYQKVEMILGGVQNIVTDVAILCLPIPILWNLQMAKQRKKQLSGVFALGGLVCIISIVRVTQVTKGSLHDPSWTAVPISTWSAAELATGILSACLPVLRPIYAFLLNRPSNVQFTSMPNTFYPRSSLSASSKNRYSGFGWTPSSPIPSSDTTRRKDHLLPFIAAPSPPNRVEGDNRWAEWPLSRLLPVYQRSRSREPFS